MSNNKTATSLNTYIQTVYPEAEVKVFSRFPNGLVSQVYKVDILNPSNTIVVKLADTKRAPQIEKSNQINKYLHSYGIPVPLVMASFKTNNHIVTISECSPGEVATTAYKQADKQVKKTILSDSGLRLGQIHGLKAPDFWVHHRHEIKSREEWIKWTNLRIGKYLKFSQEHLKDYYHIIKNELSIFQMLLGGTEIDFVPMHWDYNMSNFNVYDNGYISGIFDFDNAMKGHSLADIGIALQWFESEFNNSKAFRYFLDGYKNNISEEEAKLIKGYCLLHLLATTRSVWDRQESLGWIIDRNKRILNNFDQLSV
ncbi:MAG: phosphotransferase [Candidatus Saccharimonadales bacterium]